MSRLTVAKLSLIFMGLTFVGFGGFLVYLSLLAEVRVWTTFQPTTATITSNKMGSWPGRGIRFEPLIAFAYRVEGVDYKNGRFRITPESLREAPAEAVLKQYPLGSKHPAWFDPADPSVAVLDRGLPTGGLFGVVCCLIGIIGVPLMWPVVCRIHRPTT